MEIHFEDEDFSNLAKRKGKFQHVQPQLENQLKKLHHAKNLDEFARTFPRARCHEYKGDQKGIFTIDLTGNWRLRFRPYELTEGVELKDGVIDWKEVTAIVILGVNDPH